MSKNPSFKSVSSREISPVLLERITARIGYQFSNPYLLHEALSHPSLQSSVSHSPPQHRKESYERLEFLGDRVLSLVSAEWLWERYPHENVGDLSLRLSTFVCNDTLVKIAQSLDLEQYIQVAPHVKRKPFPDSILADTCESIIGALYLDGGMEAVRGFIRIHWGGLLEHSTSLSMNSKMVLQEWTQKHHKLLPYYYVVNQTGPDHQPYFEVEVSVNEKEKARGLGKSRQDAEKMAAQNMLERLKINE